MKRSRGPYISGPHGQGTPYEQVYNEDGSPNFAKSVEMQAEASKNLQPSNDNSHIQDKGQEYVDGFVKNLNDNIAKFHEQYEKANNERNITDDKNSLQPGIKEHQKGHQHELALNEQNISKDEPEMER